MRSSDLGAVTLLLTTEREVGRKNVAGKLCQADAATGKMNPGKNHFSQGSGPQAGQEQSEPLFCLLGASLPSPCLPRSFPRPERRLQKVPPLLPATVCRDGREWAKEKPRPPLKLKGGSGVNTGLVPRKLLCCVRDVNYICSVAEARRPLSYLVVEPTLASGSLPTVW